MSVTCFLNQFSFDDSILLAHFSFFKGFGDTHYTVSKGALCKKIITVFTCLTTGLCYTEKKEKGERI